MPNYLLYDISHAALRPWRAMAEAAKLCFDNPFNPVAHTAFGRNMTAACELFERTTRRYEKPAFSLSSTLVDGVPVRVCEEVVWARPFCNLLHFRKELHHPQPAPRLLIVAPMSGHYATLLRGTVEAMLPRCDVYITDWVNASMVPTSAGSFDLDDYIDYVIDMLHALGPNTHVMAVCQPSVPVLAAVALMEEEQDAFAPRSMTLMGGPIDTRVNPTAVNRLAMERGTDWFRRNAIMRVPLGHPWIMMRSATDLSKADLHVFSKFFDDGLERGQEAEAFSWRQIGGRQIGGGRIGGYDVVLDFFVGHLINIEMTRQPAP